MDYLNRAFQRVWISTHAYINHVKRTGEGEIYRAHEVCMDLRDLFYLTDRRILLYMKENPYTRHVSPSTQCDMVAALCKHVIKHFQGSVDLFFSKYPVEEVATQMALLATSPFYVDLESSDAICLTLTSCFPAR